MGAMPFRVQCLKRNYQKSSRDHISKQAVEVRVKEK